MLAGLDGLVLLLRVAAALPPACKESFLLTLANSFFSVRTRLTLSGPVDIF